MKATAGIIVHLLLLLIVSSVVISCVGKRTSKDWSKMNLDDLEKQWEQGDEEEELRTERQIEAEKLEQRRKEAAASKNNFNPGMMKNMGAADLGAMAAGHKDAAGPTMMFAQVGSGLPAAGDTGGGGGHGEETISKEETDEVAGRLQQLAQLGGLSLSVYSIDPGSVLISTQKGWEGKEILNFLLSRPEVSKVTWNNKDFFQSVESEL